MQGIIIVSGQLTASNTDILNNTRLSPAPANGFLTFELEADLADATNNYVVTLQMPDGQVPMEQVLVPASPQAVDGALGQLDKMKFTVPVGKGGNVIFQATESGTAVLTYRVTFSPLRQAARGRRRR